MRTYAYEEPSVTLRVAERATCHGTDDTHIHSTRIVVTGSWSDGTHITVSQVPTGFFDQADHACRFGTAKPDGTRAIDTERLAAFLRTQIPGATSTILFDYTSDPADPPHVPPDLVLLHKYESWTCRCALR
jgi:hypothetical protein